MKIAWGQEKYIEAFKFAAGAHGRQRVPGSKLPYVVHPCMVAMEVIAAIEAEPGRSSLDILLRCANNGSNVQQAYSDGVHDLGDKFAEEFYESSEVHSLPRFSGRYRFKNAEQERVS